MTSRSLNYVQQGGEDEENMDCASKFKRLTTCITKNKLIGEIDFFSLDVRFMIKGQEDFRTLFSGFIGLLTIVLLGAITYLIAWPDTFSSNIIKTEYTSDSSSSGLSIFSYVNQPISFRVKPLSPSDIIPPQFGLKMYYLKTGKSPIEVKLDTNCKYGSYCLTKNLNQQTILQIFGGRTASESAGLSLEVFWCTLGSGCIVPDVFQFSMSFQNTQKRREKVLIPYQVSTTLQYRFGYGSQFIFDFGVTRQKYTSNNKILGHISNLLPESFQTYEINSLPQVTQLYTTNHLISTLQAPQVPLFSANLKYSNKKSDINEKFVNIITPILFFFSLLDPFKWLLHQFILKRYNMNCRNLYIANKIYYVEDPQKYEKYDFGGGFIVFMVCLMHKHAIAKLSVWLLSFFGKNLVDVLPQKCIHTMNMIDKGASLMCENVFFGSLQELSTLEDCPGKKIPFNDVDTVEEEDQEDEPEADYFAQNPTRKAAFLKFCKDNEYYSGKRKNKVYQILLDKKFTTFLKDGIHKQFETYVRNIENLKLSGNFTEKLNEMNIPVDVVQGESRGDQTQTNMKLGKVRPA